MRLDDPLCDAQAEAAALNFTASRLVTPEEPVENAWQHRSRDTLAGVSDGEFRRAAVSLQGNVHAPIGMVVLDGILREIQQQLAQAMTIAAHGHLVAGDKRDVDLPGLREDLCVRKTISHQ